MTLPSRYWSLARVIDGCLMRPASEPAWQEFVRRFDFTIHRNVEQAFTNWMGHRTASSQPLSREMRDKLVQSVYRRLVEDRSRLLRQFRIDRAGSFDALLGIVATRVVSSHLRGAAYLEAGQPIEVASPTIRRAAAV